MKKLMIAAAIVCVAAVSQAAPCYWNFKTTENISTIEREAYSGDVYIFQSALTTQDTILQAIIAGNDLTSEAGYFVTLSAVNGAIAKIDGADQNPAWTTESTGSKVGFFAVAKDAANVLLTDTMLKNEQQSKSGQTVSIDVSWLTLDPELGGQTTPFDGTVPGAFAAKAATDRGTGEGWYSTAAVPEPTSGLLLILGVAGLALRRRRA